MTPATTKISQAKLEALEAHTLANLFPFASDDEVDSIALGIISRGFRKDRPIILFKGQILDVRNRRRAALKAVELSGKYRTAYVQNFVGDISDALEFVLSENLRRRHMSVSQKAIIAANLAQWELGMNQHDEQAANLPTQKHAAKALSVSERTIRMANRICERGPELEKAVMTGLLTVHTAEALIELGDKELVKVLAGEQKAVLVRAKEIRTSRKQVSRQMRTAKINAIAAQGSGQMSALPIGSYPLILCDAPWENEVVYDEETGNEKSPPYPTMSIPEIMGLFDGDKSPALEDAAIFFWVTNNRLDDGIDVIRHWGFDYVTSYAWGKEGETEGMGMGFWVRDCHEVLLIGKRGKMLPPDQTTLERSLHYLRKKKHSEKPELFARIIDKQWPDLPKLELFQRKQSLVEGDIRLHKREKGRWSFWGFEASAEGGEAGGAV